METFFAILLEHSLNDFILNDEFPTSLLQGFSIKLSDELVFHRSALEDLRKRLAAQKAKSATIDVATFKELTGVSRKYAIPLLEYLDRERVTRRVGDKRQIL